MLQEHALFVAFTTNLLYAFYYRLDARSDFNYKRTYISNYIENLDGPLKTLHNKSHFTIVLQFLVLQSPKHYFQH